MKKSVFLALLHLVTACNIYQGSDTSSPLINSKNQSQQLSSMAIPGPSQVGNWHNQFLAFANQNITESQANLSMYDSAFKYFELYNTLIQSPFSSSQLLQAKTNVIDSLIKKIHFPLYSENSVINLQSVSIYALAKPKIDELFTIGAISLGTHNCLKQLFFSIDSLKNSASSYSQVFVGMNLAITHAENYYLTIDSTSNEGIMLGYTISVAKNSFLYWDTYNDGPSILQPCDLPLWVGLDLLGLLGGIAGQIISDVYDGKSIDWAKGFLLGAANAIFASIGGTRWFIKLYKLSGVV